MRSSSRRQSKRILSIGMIGLCLSLIGLSGCSKEALKGNQAAADPAELTEGWEYRWGDSPFDASGLPIWIYEDSGNSQWKSIPYDDGILNPPDRQDREILWLRVALPDEIRQSPQIGIQQIAFAAEIFLQKELIYRFKSINVPKQGRFTESRSHRFALPSDFQKETLFFRIYSADPTQIGLTFVRLGSQEGYTRLLINEIFSMTIFGFFFAAAGILVLVLFVFRRKEKLYFVFGSLCLTMGLWILSSTRIGQEFLSSPPLVFYLTSLMPFFSAAGFCAYFEQIYGSGYRSIIRRLWQFFLSYGVLSLILLLFKLNFNYIFAVMFGFFAAFAMAIVILFFTSLKKAFKGNREAAIISAGFTVVAFFGLYDILGGIFKLFPWTNNTYQWGMFVFIISLGFVLERRFRYNAIELAKSNKKLQEYSLTLEKKVKERTQDLEDKNVELASTLHELKSTQDQLVMQEKMASLGNLVAGVAHEINTPVGAVRSSSDVLSRGLRKVKAILKSGLQVDEILSSQDFKKSLRILEENIHITSMASERIANIVKSLKSFARLDEAEYQKANIHEGLDSTLTLINYEMKDRILVQKDYGEIPEINCYPNQLNQVFMNIIMNAIAAVGEDGIITIKTTVLEKNLVIQVSDNGSGIPEEHLDRIFDPGFTTRSHGVGTGLGLSISYNIIQKHQGEIKVESKVGQGSTFSIFLPIDLDSQ